ncbi:PREDICTED: proton-coupled amino acid transporter 3-like [Amphimedon queenslandica]|uniref:Amino acid transporter transmembrane domain-containing protein n=1 Tax=Amphimedon queenslandica TaxID=400682 RepID=A0AAN0IMQ6_AMPQE|nr:PREDICTED: proton-coupled amino acid transporter 3-like [Amphimedon queenslandica]|eukprot:XP_011404084.1 PREDICTED: proton-coupled amino acid transporter 3-like [Amphimedon queenslandica]
MAMQDEEQRLTEYAADSDDEPKKLTKDSHTRSKKKDHKKSDIATFFHLLRANLGIWILTLPLAIKNGGYIYCSLFISARFIVLTLFIDAVRSNRNADNWWHGNLLLGKAGGKFKNEESSLTYSEAMQLALQEREASPRIVWIGKYTVNVSILISQLGFCSIYFVYFGLVLQEIFQQAFCVFISYKVFVAIAIFPLVLYSCLDNLAPLSFLTKIALTFGLTIVLYDEVHWFYDKKAALISNEEELNEIGTVFGISMLLGTTVFTFERTSTILSLESKMKTPSHAKPLVYLSMFIVTLWYTFFGVFGYLTYGENTMSSVIMNLCPQKIPITILMLLIKLLLIFSIFLSHSIQFYIPMNIIEPEIVRLFTQLAEKLPPMLIIYEDAMEKAVRIIYKTSLILFTAIVAMFISNLGDLLTLIGSLASTTLALIFPSIIHLLTFWKEREEDTKEDTKEDKKEERQKKTFTCIPLLFVIDIAVIMFGVIVFACGLIASMYSTVQDFTLIHDIYIACPGTCNFSNHQN